MKKLAAFLLLCSAAYGETFFALTNNYNDLNHEADALVATAGVVKISAWINDGAHPVTNQIIGVSALRVAYPSDPGWSNTYVLGSPPDSNGVFRWQVNLGSGTYRLMAFSTNADIPAPFFDRDITVEPSLSVMYITPTSLVEVAGVTVSNFFATYLSNYIYNSFNVFNTNIVDMHIETNITQNWTTNNLGANPPTNGTYFIRADNGTLTWQPVIGFWGSNLNVQISTGGAWVTNTFSVSGTNDQTWTWTGGTTQILIKAVGAGGGGSSSYGWGSLARGYWTVTNGETLTLRVPYTGANSTRPAPATSGWPGGGVYSTQATVAAYGGGGMAMVLSGTNLILIAAGAGAQNGNAAEPFYGSGGWPVGFAGAGSGSGGGASQTNGGAAGTSGRAGSYLQGADGTTNQTTQYCGGGGLYGGGSSSSSSGGGGSSYLSPLLSNAWASNGPNYPEDGMSTAGRNNSNGRILIITPVP